MSQSELGARRGTSTDRAIRKRIEKLNDSLITDFTKDSRDIHRPEIKRKRSSLEEEFERPEVQALLRKYNPKSTDFSDFEKSSTVGEEIRDQYKNRVESDYKHVTSIDQSSSGYQSEPAPSPPDTNRTPDSWQSSMTSHSRERSMDSDDVNKPMLDRNRFSGKVERPETVSPGVPSRSPGSRFTQNRLTTNTLDELDAGNNSTDNKDSRPRDDAPSRLSPRSLPSSSFGTKTNTHTNNTDTTSPNRHGDNTDTVNYSDEFISHRTRQEHSPRTRLDNSPRTRLDTSPQTRLDTSPRTRLDTPPQTRLDTSPETRLDNSPRSSKQEPGDDFVAHRTRSDRTPTSPAPPKPGEKFVAHRTREEQTARPRSPDHVEDDFVPHRTRQDRTDTSPRSLREDSFVPHRTRSNHATPPGDEIEPKLGVRSYTEPADEMKRSPLKTEPPKKFTPSKIEPAKKFTPVKFDPSKFDGTRSLPANYRSEPPRFDRPVSPVNQSQSSKLPANQSQSSKSPANQSQSSKSPKFGVLNSPSRRPMNSRDSSPSRRPMNPREYAVTNAAVHRLQDTPQIIEPHESRDVASTNHQPVFNENSLGIDLYASRIAMGQKAKAPSECSERSSRLDPQTYQSYTAGLLHSTRKSDRFLRMHKFYSNIERVTELEHELGKSPSGPCDRKIKQIKQKDKEIQSELTEVVDDIISAQKKDKFVHDLGKLEKFQWNPNRERGLLNRPKSLGDLKKVYENESEPMNTSFSRKKAGNEEPIQKRQLSFDKLKEKYAHEDSRENKMANSPVDRGLVQRSKSVEPLVQRPAERSAQRSMERTPVKTTERASVQNLAERAPFQSSAERAPFQSSAERAPFQSPDERAPHQRSVDRTPVRTAERAPFQSSAERAPVRTAERALSQSSAERVPVQSSFERAPFERPVERSVQRPVERFPVQAAKKKKVPTATLR